MIRLHGSYESLKYGSVLEGLADLTGGVVETIPLRYNQIQNKLNHIYKCGNVALKSFDFGLFPNTSLIRSVKILARSKSA